MDATIAGDAIDLKFRNTCKCPIYIQAYVDANKVNVSFYKINMTFNNNNSKVYYFKMNKYLQRKTMGNNLFEVY
jgi:vancomycin resistance protein YoaR